MISDPQMGQMKVGYFITKFPALSYNSKDAKHPNIFGYFSDIINSHKYNAFILTKVVFVQINNTFSESHIIRSKKQSGKYRAPPAVNYFLVK